MANFLFTIKHYESRKAPGGRPPFLKGPAQSVNVLAPARLPCPTAREF